MDAGDYPSYEYETQVDNTEIRSAAFLLSPSSHVLPTRHDEGFKLYALAICNYRRLRAVLSLDGSSTYGFMLTFPTHVLVGGEGSG